MRFHRWVAALAFVAALGLAADARAQTGYVEGFGGVLIVDDGELSPSSVDPAPLFGGVLGFALAPNWEAGVAYGYAPVTASIEGEGDFDGSVHVYFGAVNYILPTQTTAKFFLSGGVGGQTTSLDIEGVDSANDLMLNFGGGVRFMASDRIAIQGIARDYVQFCSMDTEEGDKATLCPVDDTTLHHIEISGGLLYLF